MTSAEARNADATVEEFAVKLEQVILEAIEAGIPDAQISGNLHAWLEALKDRAPKEEG